MLNLDDTLKSNGDVQDSDVRELWLVHAGSRGL